MIQVHFAKKFDKSFAKLGRRQAIKVMKTIDDFASGKVPKKMRFHELKGEHAGVWSLSVGGDLRVHFEYI